jgi:uncharacterized protein
MKKLLAIVLVLFACNVFGESIAEWRKKAEAGDAEAQFNLGVIYNNGQGVARDEKEAVKWFRKATDQGVVEAEFNLGLIYQVGSQREIKLKERIEEADKTIANFLKSKAAVPGIGVLLNPQIEAKKQEKSELEKQLSELGYKSNEEAATWFLRAAKRGYPQAQLALGVLYAKGEGVLKDDVAAYAWFNLAGFHGSQQGAKGRELLAKKMTPEQIAKAQKLSKELLMANMTEADLGKKSDQELQGLINRAKPFERFFWKGTDATLYHTHQMRKKFTGWIKAFYTKIPSGKTELQIRKLSYYENGKPWTTFVWKPNGERCVETTLSTGNGTETHWHPNGQKREQSTYNNGKANGRYGLWYPNGKKEEEGVYKAGRMDGVVIHYTNEGQELGRGTFRQGHPVDGTIVKWFKNGGKQRFTFKDSKPEGPIMRWYPNGNKQLEGTLKDGKMKGLWIQYNEDGTVRSRTTYRNGIPVRD